MVRPSDISAAVALLRSALDRLLPALTQVLVVTLRPCAPKCSSAPESAFESSGILFKRSGIGAQVRSESLLKVASEQLFKCFRKYAPNALSAPKRALSVVRSWPIWKEADARKNVAFESDARTSQNLHWHTGEIAA
jgi:hypothetical protein